MCRSTTDNYCKSNVDLKVFNVSYSKNCTFRVKTCFVTVVRKSTQIYYIFKNEFYVLVPKNLVVFTIYRQKDLEFKGKVYRET